MSTLLLSYHLSAHFYLKVPEKNIKLKLDTSIPSYLSVNILSTPFLCPLLPHYLFRYPHTPQLPCALLTHLNSLKQIFTRKSTCTRKGNQMKISNTNFSKPELLLFFYLFIIYWKSLNPPNRTRSGTPRKLPSTKMQKKKPWKFLTKNWKQVFWK